MSGPSFGEPGQGRALLAPAKLNLTLEILGRRPDGYHELESLVVFAGIGDRLEVGPGSELTLEVTGPFAGELAGSEEDNLVLRAARLLAQAGGVEGGARLKLAKMLPVGAGLGGGSSDAAVTLKALNHLWDLSLPGERLAELALPLGADLPVCLYGRPALMRGLGDQLEPAPPLPPLWVLLVNPRQSLATADVYQARQGPFSAPGIWWRQQPQSAAEAATLLKAKPNDLQVPARKLCPAIQSVLSAIEGTSGCLLARMSGSGASCFGLYGTAKEAEAAAAVLAAAHPAWWIEPAPVLGEEDSAGAARRK